jgi:hypothetical protein
METENLNRNWARCSRIPMKMGSPEMKNRMIIVISKNQPGPALYGTRLNTETLRSKNFGIAELYGRTIPERTSQLSKKTPPLKRKTDM